jgi:hypothetical protein
MDGQALSSRRSISSQSQANEFQAQRVVWAHTGQAVYGPQRGASVLFSISTGYVYILMNLRSMQLMIPVLILDLRLKLIINVVVDD